MALDQICFLHMLSSGCSQCILITKSILHVLQENLREAWAFLGCSHAYGVMLIQIKARNQCDLLKSQPCTFFWHPHHSHVYLQAVWFSASADLALDAERDFHDIGALRYDPVRNLICPLASLEDFSLVLRPCHGHCLYNDLSHMLPEKQCMT